MNYQKTLRWIPFELYHDETFILEYITYVWLEVVATRGFVEENTDQDHTSEENCANLRFC